MLKKLLRRVNKPRVSGTGHNLYAEIESPPSSKKLSVIPTRSSPSTSRQIRASSFWSNVRGSTWSVFNLDLFRRGQCSRVHFATRGEREFAQQD